ncbi:hypothetical protein Taro_030981 [Colocasia esculenta]|uniref:RING-type domain-containing protein n=1 Tax=Colocasia esculenta TaxID=4460 RepID=A0A843VVH0_COLES|nr:hypothetical protein [Colocasia esculenta]
MSFVFSRPSFWSRAAPRAPPPHQRTSPRSIRAFSTAPKMPTSSLLYCVLAPKPLVVLVVLLDKVRLLVSTPLFYLGFYFASDILHTAPTAVRRPRSLRSHGVNEAEGRKEKGEKEEHVCVVCLCLLAAGDEVRELGNCRHAFHCGCIDRWVDQGRLTCPLCRARLLPWRWERRESWKHLGEALHFRLVASSSWFDQALLREYEAGDLYEA